VPEDVARQAFRLLQQLDSEQIVKPPTVLAVFRLYCMEELTAEQVAGRCGCSKGTVINRLKLIREKTKMEPDELRRFSRQFDKIEDDIRESKATHIHRKRMIDDSPGEDGE
jgi:DNA-directed RNA polymerase specialized sigma24 family protein